MDGRELFKFCPRCGQRTIAIQGDGALCCSACEFLLYMNAATAAGAVIADEQGRILLLRRARDPSKGKLGIPGGFVDRGESVEEAIVREVREEVNLEVTELEYLYSYPNRYFYREITYVTADLFFACRVKDWSALKALDEVDGCELIPLDKIRDEELAFPSVKVALEAYRKKLSPRSRTK